jgi:cell division protein FtsB
MKNGHSKILPIFLLVLLIILQYRFWFANGGVVDMMRLKKQLTAATQENDQLKKRNQKLTQQVQHLQNNQLAVESRARHELGMVKQGETFYQMVNE